jgi:hypothetical protein
MFIRVVGVVVGMKKIVDEFSELKVSRQRKYQLRHMRDGLCEECGEKAVSAWHCLRHMILVRESKRMHAGYGRRYNSLSYRLEKENK